MNGSKLLLVTACLILMLALSAHPTPAQTSIAACGTINASGSFVLTGNLSAAGTCLSVVNGDVTIDLRGFTISGNNTGFGINGSSNTNISILNGTVKGFAFGVLLFGDGARVENMRVLANQAAGIEVDNGCTLRNNSVRENVGHGIAAGDHCVITGNTVYGNSGDGIRVGASAVIRDNTADNNGGFGIRASGVISGNIADSNSGDGIFAREGSVVIGNTAVSNANNGIEADCRSAVNDNAAALIIIPRGTS